MKVWQKLAVAGAATTLLAGCSRHQTIGVAPGELSSGVLAVDSLSATRTALLRADNSGSSEVRIYIKQPGMAAQYVARAMPGDVRTTVLDPNLFPASAMSFEIRSADGAQTRTLGPFKIYKNQTVDLVIPADMSQSRGVVRNSTP
ncbi:MAG TPA: hypothetical protein VGM67_01150 [Gemmatimonadaceae bacterium]|jgi:hypothetical protein